MSWDADERADADDARELKRLFRRAWRRPLRTIFFAALMAAGVAGLRARKAPSYTARVVLRVTEGDLETGQKTLAPPPNPDIRGYIQNAVFTKERLLEVMKQYGVSNSRRKIDPAGAAEDFREDIEVDVWRNYFLGGGEDDDDEPRSARVGIAVSASTPDRAMAMASELAQLVIDSEQSQRALALEHGIATVDQSLPALRSRLDDADRDIARARLAVERSGDAKAILQLGDATAERERVVADIDKLTRRRAQLLLERNAEQQQLGLEFTRVDEKKPQAMSMPRRTQLMMLALIVFLVTLPISAIGVAAFDDRIDQLDDVRRLGLVPLGHVPAFPGSTRASLREREPTARP